MIRLRKRLLQNLRKKMDFDLHAIIEYLEGHVKKKRLTNGERKTLLNAFTTWRHTPPSSPSSSSGDSGDCSPGSDVDVCADVDLSYFLKHMRASILDLATENRHFQRTALNGLFMAVGLTLEELLAFLCVPSRGSTVGAGNSASGSGSTVGTGTVASGSGSTVGAGTVASGSGSTVVPVTVATVSGSTAGAGTVASGSGSTVEPVTEANVKHQDSPKPSDSDEPILKKFKK